MKHIILFFKLQFIVVIFLVSQISAQQLIEVEASGMIFSPENITIDAGDTVRWTNTSGFHNVNGTIATFPSNPESFGNSTGSGWVFEHVFTVPGSYDYHCDVHFSSGMVGTVTVVDASSVTEVDNGSFRVYPNPAKDYINIGLNESILKDGPSIAIYDLLGTEIKQVENVNSRNVRVDLDTYPLGAYFVKISNSANISISKRFIKQ